MALAKQCLPECPDRREKERWLMRGMGIKDPMRATVDYELMVVVKLPLTDNP
jgi:hypothetical protein